MSAADRAWRTVGFVGEVSAVMVAGLFELLSPRDKSGEHFAGAAASLPTSPGQEKQPEPADPHKTWPGDCFDHCVGHPETPQPSPVTTHTSAGDSSAAAGTLPPTAAAEPLTWLGWAVPAILEVLAEHRPINNRVIDGATYCCDEVGAIHAEFGTTWEWREHIAPILAERIACDPARAIAALENFQPK